jgi:hypothetical protein
MAIYGLFEIKRWAQRVPREKPSKDRLDEPGWHKMKNEIQLIVLSC